MAKNLIDRTFTFGATVEKTVTYDTEIEIIAWANFSLTKGRLDIYLIHENDTGDPEPKQMKSVPLAEILATEYALCLRPDGKSHEFETHNEDWRKDYGWMKEIRTLLDGWITRIEGGDNGNQAI